SAVLCAGRLTPTGAPRRPRRGLGLAPRRLNDEHRAARPAAPPLHGWDGALSAHGCTRAFTLNGFGAKGTAVDVPRKSQKLSAGSGPHPSRGSPVVVRDDPAAGVG